MLRNCPHCGRLLTTAAGMPCEHCLAEENAAAERIQTYLDEGGSRTVADVARDTGLALTLLRRLMRDGRIVLAETADGICVLCGRSLEGAPGRLCARCAAKVKGQIGGKEARGTTSGPAAVRAPVPGRPFGFYSRVDDKR